MPWAFENGSPSLYVNVLEPAAVSNLFSLRGPPITPPLVAAQAWGRDAEKLAHTRTSILRWGLCFDSTYLRHPTHVKVEMFGHYIGHKNVHPKLDLSRVSPRKRQCH